MNYELGVLIPLRTEEEIDKATCWERPPLKYVAGRDMPWVSSTCRAVVGSSDVDRYGLLCRYSRSHRRLWSNRLW